MWLESTLLLGGVTRLPGTLWHTVPMPSSCSGHQGILHSQDGCVPPSQQPDLTFTASTGSDTAKSDPGLPGRQKPLPAPKRTADPRQVAGVSSRDSCPPVTLGAPPAHTSVPGLAQTGKRAKPTGRSGSRHIGNDLGGFGLQSALLAAGLASTPPSTLPAAQALPG